MDICFEQSNVLECIFSHLQDIDLLFVGIICKKWTAAVKLVIQQKTSESNVLYDIEQNSTIEFSQFAKSWKTYSKFTDKDGFTWQVPNYLAKFQNILLKNVSENQNFVPINIAFAGNGRTGLTTAIQTFLRCFVENVTSDPTSTASTFFPSYIQKIWFGGLPILLKITDFDGREDYDRSWPLAWKSADAYLLCFDVTDLNSYHYVHSLWWGDITHYGPDVPIILAGTKCDCPHTVEWSEIIPLAQKIKAYGCLFFSSKTQQNLSELFIMGIRAAIHTKLSSLQKLSDKRGKKCCVQ